MSTLKFSELNTAPDLTDLDFIVGIRYNSVAGTYTNYKYTTQQFSDAVLNASRKLITADADGDDLADTWMNGKVVIALSTDRATYLRDIDFTQTGGIITGINISFYEGQKVLAMI